MEDYYQIGIHKKKQRVVLERIQDCLNSVVNKLHKIDYDIEKLESDEEFAELTVNTLERVIKTLNAQKREYFSNLIANSAVNINSKKREEMRSMSALLDQLEIVHILTLEKVMKLPHDQSVHFFGPVRTISDFDVREFSKKEHHALGTLDELGLIDLSEVPIGKDNYVVPLKVNSRGISFHKWITEPKN
ncbi:hypothetical protein [Fodinibius halophilus]|uniref:Uncharacterized protein n=1 Tax=Fodinibius halophilus TaxID=1736908 RepID=A0A6M1TJM4_9BACT|nr:hypothetical protein [Fodinibius halophilus]NGP90252.1 hypothetical protein [Fodinibius halophilus]